MKTTILLLVSTAGLFAQSLAVTSPANGSVVTWGFPLTAAPSALPSVAQVRFYVDNRLECVANAQWLGVWSCPKLHYATYSDERAATIYAEAYNAVGTLLATSGTNTFRINNGGVNAVTTFTDGTGAITRGATTSGSVTVNISYNAIHPAGFNFVGSYSWDGSYQVPQTMYAPNSNLTTSNGYFTVPFITGHTGSSVYVNCNQLDGTSCAGGTGDIPSAYSFGTGYYLAVLAANTVCLATTFSNAQAGTCVTGGNQGVSTEYTQIYFLNAEWISAVSGNGTYWQYNIDTTYFLNGRHRQESLVGATGVPSTWAGTFTLASAAITLANGHVHSVNFPLTQGGPFTVSGTTPPEWSGTMYAIVLGPDDFCPASSASNAAAGTCISVSSVGSGTDTVSFNAPNLFWQSPGNGANKVYGTDINWLTFSNGAVPMALRTKYARVAGIAGDTFSLAPYVLNCDGSTTSISASSAIYSTADSTRATVSTLGVVTLGSTTGHTLISVVDNVHLRQTMVDVEVRNDRTTFKQFSKGFGILNSYDPVKSVVGVTPFNGIIDVLDHNPFPIKYVKPAFTAMIGGFVSTTLTLNYANYAAWLTDWNASAANVYSKAFAIQTFNASGGLLFYGDNDAICGGYNAYLILSTPWRQQAMATMLNDMAPYTLGFEHCDEMTTPWSNAMKPLGGMGGGQDSIGNSTLGGQAAGMTSIVTSGGVTTVNLSTWGWVNGGGTLQITGAASANCANLNGPHTASNFTFGHNSPIGSYITSFQINNVGAPDGTCNFASDPNIMLTENQEGEGSSVSATNSPTGWGSALTSVVCSSNTCTVHWTAHPLANRQTVTFRSFTTAGLNGLHRADVVDANTFTVLLTAVANGTYNTATDPGVTMDAIANFPQTFVTSMFPGGSYITGGSPPMSASLLGGGNYPWTFASWYGATSNTQFVAHNITSGQGDRYGSLNISFRQFFRQRQTQPFVDGSLPINLWPVDKPVMYGTQFSGDTCWKNIATMDCRPDQLPGDQIGLFRNSGGKIFASNAVCWLMPNAAGCKPYQFISGLGTQWAPPSPVTGQLYQASPNWIDQYPDQYLALASVHLAMQHEDKYILQPPLSSPDINTGPGPFPLLECSSHQSAAGNAMLCLNMSEEQQTVTIDTSIINLGGPMRRWTLSAFGDTVKSLSPSTTTDTVTFPYGQALLYVSQPTGAVDDLKTINVSLTPAYGAAKAVLEIHYFPGDQMFQSVDCGAGFCPPTSVNLHNLDVYVRKRFTKSDGTPVAIGDLERLAAQ